MTDLMQYAERWPWLLFVLVVVGTGQAAIERVFALSGPVTKVMEWWRGRELAKLRREALLRAEKRAIEAQEESAIIADLRAQVAWLQEEVARLRADTAPLRATRNPARPPPVPR